MTRNCPQCGALNRSRARFCDQCGTTLTDATAPASRWRPELRQGTLLFCDLVQSTQLANELDPDDLRQVFAAFQRTVREVSWRHGGYLVRFLGDGAFVVFGYPAAQEDSAESAVHAGLALVRGIHDEGTPGGRALQLRVGIASGPVVMGEMIGGAAIGEQSVTGPVAHLAARLAATAAPDAVLVCDDTRRLIGQHFTLASLGLLELKGFPRPVPAWQALAVGAPMSRFDAHRAGGSGGELIGRVDMMQALAQRWQQAAQGQGGGLLLLGEAGVGKSRLARTLQLRVSTESALHLDLHCTPRTQGSPLFPVAVLLRRLADIQSGEDETSRSDKARLLLQPLLAADAMDSAMRYLRELFAPGAAAMPEPDSPEQVRQRTIATLVDLVRGMAARRPVFLLVEDLHWSDPTTRALLAQLLEAAAQLPLLLLITAREAELAAGGAELPHTQILRLDALTSDDARALVQQCAAALTPLPAGVVDSIVARGEGNALFLEELTQAACQAAALGEVDIPAGADRLPTTLQTLVQARLDRLPELKPVVQAAAVLGREFRWPLLARLADDPLGLDGTIGRLVDDGLLVPTGSAAYGGLRFKHALIHDAVYATLLRGDRQRLHSRAAELLVGDFAGSADASAEQLAHHLSQAARYADAVRCLLQASHENAGRAAYQEAIAHGQGGLALLPQLTEPAVRRPLELRLLMQLGVALTATMGYAAPVVEQTYARASELCDESTPADELFPLLRGMATYYLVRGPIERADQLARQCLALAQRTQRADHLIDAQSFAAYPAMYLGRLAESQQLSEAALALYEAEQGERFSYPIPQDPATVSWSIVTTTAWMLGRLQQADAAAERLQAHMQRLGQPFNTAFGTVWLSASCQLQRRFALALQHGQAGLAISQQHGFGTWTPAATMELCIAQGALAPSPESIGLLQAVHQAFLQAGAELSATFYQWGLAQAMVMAGDLAAARDMASAGIERAEQGQETYMKAELLTVRAAAQTDDAAAVQDLRAAVLEAERQGALTVALRAASHLLPRVDRDPERLAVAQASLAVIDGGCTQGLPPDWVQRQLATLRPALGLPQPVQPALA